MRKEIGCMVSHLKTNSITYKEDIIKELSEELSIPFKEIEEIVNLNIEYIKKSINENDNLIISLPNLCRIRLNHRLALSYIGQYGNTKYKIRQKKVVQLKRKLENFSNYKIENKDWNNILNLKKPLFERLLKKSKRLKYVNNISQNMYKMINELEEITNQIKN